MNEIERQVLTQTAETLIVVSAALAQSIRGLSAIRLVLRDGPPDDFEQAYLSHFAEAAPEDEKVRQQILAKSDELAGLLRTLNRSEEPR